MFPKKLSKSNKSISKQKLISELPHRAPLALHIRYARSLVILLSARTPATSDAAPLPRPPPARARASPRLSPAVLPTKCEIIDV